MVRRLERTACLDQVGDALDQGLVNVDPTGPRHQDHLRPKPEGRGRTAGEVAGTAFGA